MTESEGSWRETDAEASVSEYQVFLSFRGPDTRQGLASVLYSDMTAAGIRVFKDDNELEIGRENSEILTAITNSRVCVPIFSRTFAASTWCLREVETMVRLEKIIVPIFYTASPDDVKLKTEMFKADLRKHEAELRKQEPDLGADKVRKWEEALRVAARNQGLEVKNTGYAEFSKKFVKTLLNKLKVKTKYVTDTLVQRDYQKEALMKLLDIGADDARIVVGIHGLGGTGKTTLAAVLFNEISARFDCRSFLEDIGEPVRRNGLAYLHQKLLEDLDPKLKEFREIDHVMVLKQTFHNKKVLVVLDNVDQRKQVEAIGRLLDHFGSGSRIIITARDTRVFTEKARAFEVKEMNEDEALQLFSKHAFGSDSPPSNRYRMLSNEAVCLTGRLPLALGVIGSLLQGCNENQWKKHTHKLKKVPHQDVLEKLKLSFDALDEEQKQIFLDIACFFINKDPSSATHMWEACEFFPGEGIEVLQSMSLVAITSDGKFWMHDLIRDLGRELVRRECFDDPAKRSRIWSEQEAREVLKMKQGKKNVQGLLLDEPIGSNSTNREFSSFRILRLLKLVGTELVGDFEDLLPQLRWFSWHQCPSDFSPTNLSLGKLVVLDLSRSLVTETWAGWSLLQMAKHLKELDLTDCRNLRSTPDLSGNEALESLILRGCRNLTKVHSSISKLKTLRHLDLQRCYSLLGEASDEFGLLDPSSLEILNLSRTSVTENWAGWSILQRAKNLKVLDLTECHDMKNMPDFSGNEALERLILRGCHNLERADSSIGKLTRLRHLDLHGCSHLGGLEKELGSREDLEVIRIGMEGTFRSLKKFHKIGIRSGIPDTRLIHGVGDLKSLVESHPNRLVEFHDQNRAKISAFSYNVERLTKLRAEFESRWQKEALERLS